MRCVGDGGGESLFLTRKDVIRGGRRCAYLLDAMGLGVSDDRTEEAAPDRWWATSGLRSCVLKCAAQ